MDVKKLVTFLNGTNELQKYNINVLNKALYIASEEGYLEEVRHLLVSKANIDAENNASLRYASTNGHLEVVKFLIENKADIHAVKDSSLRWASTNGHLEVVKFLLEQKADIHAIDDAALCNASQNGHLEVVKLLVQHRADINALRGLSLENAISNDHINIVKVLIENKSNLFVNSKLNLALRKGKLEIINALMAAETNNDYANLYCSVYSGNTEVIKALLDNNSNEELVHMRDDECLFIASNKEHTDIVRLLLSYKANVDRLPYYFVNKYIDNGAIGYLIELDNIINLSQFKQYESLKYFKYSDYIKSKLELVTIITNIVGRHITKIIIEYI